MPGPGEKTPFYFEDHTAGYRVECGSYAVDKEEVIAFARKWDPQPWHIDEAQARQSMFGGLTACSAHIFSIYCITSVDWQNGMAQQAVASLGFDAMRMHKPVYAGDVLRCVTEVGELRESRSKPDCGIVVYATQLLNQQDDAVFSIRCATLMARKPR